MIIKIIALILSVIIVALIGFTAVVTLVNVFEGKTVAEGLKESWNSITHLFGLIKETKADIIYPMTNKNIKF